MMDGGVGTYTVFRDGKWAEVLEEEEPKLPTLESLIEEAKSKIEVHTSTYPCWVNGERTVTHYSIGLDINQYTEKDAVVSYVARRVKELL